MKFVKTFRRTALAIAIVAITLPAFALDLSTARSSGKVGEKTDGYVAALTQSPEVTALVSEVNTRRKAEYARISKENGQPVDVVGKLAAAQIIQKLSKGSSYQNSSGAWVKK